MTRSMKPIFNQYKLQVGQCLYLCMSSCTHLTSTNAPCRTRVWRTRVCMQPRLTLQPESTRAWRISTGTLTVHVPLGPGVGVGGPATRNSYPTSVSGHS